MKQKVDLLVFLWGKMFPPLQGEGQGEDGVTGRPQKVYGNRSFGTHGLERKKGCARTLWASVGTFVLLLMTVSAQGHSEGVEKKAQPTTEMLRRQYQAGEYSAVIQAFEEGQETPRETQGLLYLGLSFLKTGVRAKAIDLLRRYRAEVSGSEEEREIAPYLTLLLQEEARQAAKTALAEETQRGGIDVNAIAVFPFAYEGDPQYRPISRGLAAMIITDLSVVPLFRVVERIRLQALLDELALSRTGLVDPESAPRTGRLAAAGRIITGGIFHNHEQNPENELFRLNGAVTQTESRVETVLPEVSGEMQTFYTLQKTLVFKILCGTGHCPEGLDSPTQAILNKVHTRSFKAFLRYSEGLEYLDAGNNREARQAFLRAVEEDPDFELARNALIETPLFPMDVAVIITGTEQIAEEGPQADRRLLSPDGALGTEVPRHLRPTAPDKNTGPDKTPRPLEPTAPGESTGSGKEGSGPFLGNPIIDQAVFLLEPVEILVPPDSLGSSSNAASGQLETVPVEIEVQF